MNRQSRSASPFTAQSILLLAFPFVAIGIAWYLLVPSIPEAEVDLAAEASAELERGNIEGAYRIIEELRKTSDDPDVLYLLAVTEGMRGNNQRALEVVQQIPDFQTDPRLLTLAGQFALAVPELAAARTMLERSLVVAPENEEAIRMLASLEGNLSNVRRVREMIAALDSIGKCTAQDVFLYCSGARVTYDLYENVDRLKPAYKNNPDMGELVYALANNYLAMNRLDAAQQVIDGAKQNPPKTNRWMVNQAALELAHIRSDNDTALAELAAIGKDGQFFAGYWIAVGRCLRQQEQPAKAIEAYWNAADLDPFDPEPLFALSKLLAASSPEKAATLARQTRRLQQLNTQVESVVTLESLEEAVERFPSIVARLVEVEAFREAEICLEWLKAQGYRSREATAAEAELKQVAIQIPRRLTPPKLTNLRVVDTSSLDGEVNLQTVQEFSSKFEDVSAQMNVTFDYTFPDVSPPTILASLGGGVATFDFDSDGSVDLFFPQAGQLPAAEDRSSDNDTLLRLRSGSYTDISMVAGVEESAYGHGATVGDLNSDGMPDLVVTNYGTNQLYVNNGDGTFSETAVAAGIAKSDWSVSSAVQDFDNDGDLDLYVVNYLQQEYCDKNVQGLDPCGPIHVPAVQDRLYENLGQGNFKDITESSGIAVPDGKGLGIVTRDFDRDGLVDLFVGNDTTHNRLFFNRSTKQEIAFKELSVRSGVAVGNDGDAEASMGIASDDVDGNGFFDIFVTNFEAQTNSWYSNIDGRTFVNDTEPLDLARSSYAPMGWGTQFLDLNDDNRLDLIVLNGRLHEGAMQPQLFCFKGNRFQSVSSSEGDYFTQKWFGRGLAIADLNNDARPDVVATHRKGAPRLLINQSGTGQRFCLRLVATQSDRNALGTRVTISHGPNRVTRVLHGGGGYLVANQHKLWMVVPTDGEIEKLTIEWPSGHVQIMANFTPSASMTIVETDEPTARILPDIL